MIGAVMKEGAETFDIIVIGGGASGMMAASIAASNGKKVCILEKNASLGEKLKITGGGRCNITNAEYDIRKLLKNYGSAEPFLYSAFAQFGIKDTFDFFESRGLPLIVQARNRAFPNTERAFDVYAVLYKELQKKSVSIITKCSVKKIQTNKSHITSVQTDRGEFSAKSFILATGGMSHPETGSTGDGFKFLKELGHTIKEPTPSIVPLEVKDLWIKKLAGVSLSFMKITFFLDDKKQFSKTGKILFTHFGISGPLILNSSTKVSGLLNSGKVTAFIDMYPDTNHGVLDDKIVKIFDMHKNKNLRTILKDIAPDGTARAFEYIEGMIDLDTKVHSIKKEDRKKFVHLLKAVPLTITNLMGYDRAVVADGGVLLSEIDTKTMRSKLYDNLYVTGDLLNINRPSGGYGLQLCWTTGFIAGKAA